MSQAEDQWLDDFNDKQYDQHFNRVRDILLKSGDYDDESKWMLNTDTSLILKVPHLNPEFF